MKLLLKVLLPFSFLLLGGYGYLHANSNHSDHCHSNRKIVGVPARISVANDVEATFTNITSGLINTGSKEKGVCEEESETEPTDYSSNKKCIELSDYFTVFKPTLQTDPAQNKNSLHTVGGFLYSSSSTYILFHVIRI